MIAPPLPPDEAERLGALWEMQILDTEPEERFDRLTRLAQEVFDAPIALVSLVDSTRQWFKSSQGLDAKETSREVSFCGHAILDDDIFVVPDATLDPRFADNPLVTGRPDIRFYAGAPLSSTDGHAVGTLCVIDTVAREWSPSQSRALRDLADIVQSELNQARIHNQQRALLALTAVTALSQEDQQSLLRQSLELGCDFLGLPIGIVSRIKDDDYEVLVQNSPEGVLVDGQHFALGQTYCQLTLESDDVLAIASMRDSAYASHPCYQAFGLESYVGVAITIDGQPFGTLNFSSPEPRPSGAFNEADVDFVRLLGRWVAATLRRWLVDDRLRDKRRILSVIGRAQSTFIENVDRAGAFDVLLNDILTLTGSEYGFIGEVLHRPDGDPYLQTRALTNIAWDEATRGHYEDSREAGLEFDNLNSLFGVTLQTGGPVISNDPYSDPRRGGLPAGHPRMDSYLGVPLHVGDRLVGMLGLANQPGGYSEETLEFLEPLAVTLGQLIEAASIQQLHREDQKSIARLSMVARQMSNGVLITDRDGCIEWVNDGFLRMTGHSPDDLLGSRPRDVLHGAGTDRATELRIFDAMANCEPFSAELLAYDKAHKTFWVNVDSNPLVGADGTVEGHMVMVTDISERKRVERMKSEFVSTISHELRTPLTSIAGALGLVAGGVAGPIPDKARTMIEIALSNSQRLTTLIDDLLDLEKLLAEGVPLESEIQDLMSVVDASIVDSQAYAAQYGVEIVGRERVEGVLVDVDSLRVLQVMANLLSNASKFSPRGSQIDVRVRRVGLTAVVEVCDHGPGIPDAFREHMFEKFSQADASDSRLRGGTGLGLAITKELIERMGGSIAYASTPGGGATFAFELPIAARWPDTATRAPEA